MSWPIVLLALRARGALSFARLRTVALAGAGMLTVQSWSLSSEQAYVLPVATLAVLLVGAAAAAHQRDRAANGGEWVVGANQDPAGPVARVLRWRPLAAMGVRGYTAYLWQVPVLWVAWSELEVRGVRSWAVVPICLAMLAVVVEASYRLTELPVLAARHPRSSATQTGVSPVQSAESGRATSPGPSTVLEPSHAREAQPASRGPSRTANLPSCT